MMQIRPQIQLYLELRMLPEHGDHIAMIRLPATTRITEAVSILELLISLNSMDC